MFESIFSMLSGDGLSAAASRVLEANLAPLYEQVRAELLKRVTGTPPPSFVTNLAARGVPVDEAGAQILWNALISSLADSPAQEAACK